MTRSAISISMPCYNRAHDLERVLSAYDNQVVDEHFEIVAIDDSSSDNTWSVFNNYPPRNFTLRTVRHEKNKGLAAARNTGLELVQAPIILFVNDDILPDQFMVKGHLATHRRYPEKEVAIVGQIQWADDLPVNTLINHIVGIGAQQFSYHYFKDGHEYDFRHFYTANVSIKTEMLRSIDQGFDTGFWLYGFEDAELSYRLSINNLKIIYQAILVGFHYHYHNIWTFTDRQYKAGVMACVLIKKHPEVKRKILSRRWF